MASLNPGFVDLTKGKKTPTKDFMSLLANVQLFDSTEYLSF